MLLNIILGLCVFMVACGFLSLLGWLIQRFDKYEVCLAIEDKMSILDYILAGLINLLIFILFSWVFYALGCMVRCAL